MTYRIESQELSSSKSTPDHHQDIICCVTLPPEAGKHPSSLRRA